MKTVIQSLLHLKNPHFGKPRSEENLNIQGLATPHIDSFNFFLHTGLNRVIDDIPIIQFKTESGDEIRLELNEFEIRKPTINTVSNGECLQLLFPKECVESGTTYAGDFNIGVICYINDMMQVPVSCSGGKIPIMLKSDKCNLKGMSPAQLVEHGELENETGGYFIVNGNSKIIRLLIEYRRNYPIAQISPSWKKRDHQFSDKGVSVRSVKDDESSTVNILHYLYTGCAKLEIRLNKRLLFFPLIMCLKILRDVPDRYIYCSLMKGRRKDVFFSDNVKTMLRQQFMLGQKLTTRKECIEFVGASFRETLAYLLPDECTNEYICNYIFKNYILPHIKSDYAKFDFLCVMTRKLYAFVADDCSEENIDHLSMHEVLLPGHTYLRLIKDFLHRSLLNIKSQIMIKSKDEGSKFKVSELDLQTAASRAFLGIGSSMTSFLATGNVPTKNESGFAQSTGMTVVMDHLNRLRDLSHLRAIHRGSFFLTLKTTAPRKLLGEAWGFICPVQTPDGAPCGLLNHLAFRCKVPCNDSPNIIDMIKIFHSIGMTCVDSLFSNIDEISINKESLDESDCRVEKESLDESDYEVVLNGELIGYIGQGKIDDFEMKLRYLKVKEEIYKYTEVIPIRRRKFGSQYPAVFISTTPTRFMRPVINLYFEGIEFIGCLEQNFLNVAVSRETIEEGVHTHVELDKTSIFSNIGNLVPFSDCNPNPRNMYQCQMGKQTMGTPIHNYGAQTANKLYRIQYPQVPLVRNCHYDAINMEEFAMGFNAIVAIVSYTGYDMEDAMVINKCSMERGLAHGQIYKTEFIDLTEMGTGQYRKSSEVAYIFQKDPLNTTLSDLDSYGLPIPGSRLSKGDPYYCAYHIEMNSYKITKYKGEDCIVDKYSIIQKGTDQKPGIVKASISLRIRRDPTIGDKFASRSGQKGIMSFLYPMEDLPFSERGISPDIIFNPHGIPSRMTAGKLIELIAGKSAAEFGLSFDSTPFEFSDENPAYEYFGKILEKAGFNYYGEDVLYSGTDGRKMQTHVFEGIVYYQRLRHMTADKWQVRSTGPVDPITRQPVKGRQRGGAIRFGEMERDCLISHGAAYLLTERMLHSSDASKEWICSSCGSIISTSFLIIGASNLTSKRPECLSCKNDSKKSNNSDGDEANQSKDIEDNAKNASQQSNYTSESVKKNGDVRELCIPYAFKYLVMELAAIGIRTQLGTQDQDELCFSSIKPPVI